MDIHCYTTVHEAKALRGVTTSSAPFGFHGYPDLLWKDTMREPQSCGNVIVSFLFLKRAFFKSLSYKEELNYDVCIS